MRRLGFWDLQRRLNVHQNCKLKNLNTVSRDFLLRKQLKILHTNIESIGCLLPSASLRLDLLEQLIILILFQPLLSFAALPHAVPNLVFGVDVDADTLLLALFPVAVVLAAIGPQEHAVALLLIVGVLAFVCATVGPLEEATTVHLVVEPIAFELASVGPFVEAIAVYIVLDEIAFVA